MEGNGNWKKWNYIKERCLVWYRKEKYILKNKMKKMIKCEREERRGKECVMEADSVSREWVHTESAWLMVANGIMHVALVSVQYFVPTPLPYFCSHFSYQNLLIFMPLCPMFSPHHIKLFHFYFSSLNASSQCSIQHI